MINAAVRHIIEPELAEGEALLWADKPNGFPIEIYDVISIAINLCFLAGILYVVDKLSLLPILALLFFCFNCLYSIMQVLSRLNHIYVLTTKRVIVRTAIFGQRFETLREYSNIVTRKNKRYGNITFLPKGMSEKDLDALNLGRAGLAQNIFKFGTRDHQKIFKFYKIIDVETVSKLIWRHLFQQQRSKT